MPRPLRYAINDWLFSRLRLRYVLYAVVVVVVAAWVAQGLGWLPEPQQVQQGPGRVGR